MLKYPIYIISKGRWEKPYTANSLTEMGVDFKIVVEPSEEENYKKTIDNNKIIVLPSNLSEHGCGSIPVRNWVWEKSIKDGDERFWILDDNLNGFERLNNNKRGKVYCDGMFRATEDFVDRYENVAFAGFEYRQFGGGARRKKPPFKTNFRVYSTTLIKTDLPYRFKGKYNEDTRICLDALKGGWVTVTMNCFLQNKLATMTIKGGNTDTIYNTGDNRKAFAEELQKAHPDCVKVVWRYGRFHHEVDYSSFEDNKLIFKKDFKPKNGVNNYGMIEVKCD